MKITLATTLIVLSLCVSAVAQTPSTATGWTEQPVTPDTATAYLEGMLQGKKHAPFKAVIADTNEKTVDRGSYCNNSSTTTGTVDDDGNIKASTSGSGGCREVYNFYYWMTVAYSDAPNSGLIITARCDVRFIWNHCRIPVVGATDGMVLEREKHGKYTIYIALRDGSLDRKGAVSKFEVTDLKHFTKNPDPQTK